jgi:DNA-binding SARP family transcriptional activator
MRIAVLGPLEVLAQEELPVVVPGAKELLLLGVLVAHSPGAVSTDSLVDALWEGVAPPTARKSLQAHLVRLRSSLEPDRAKGSTGQYVVRRGPGYALALPRADIDALHFGDLAARGHAQLASAEAPAAAREFGAALQLWRGEPYADWPDATFADAERRRLAEVRRGAVTGGLEAQLALGAHVAALPDLERLIAEDPLCEDWWRLLMLALYRGGRQADALAAGRRVRSLLAEELGSPPGPGLREMERAILAQDPALDLPAAVTPRPLVRAATGSCPYKGLAAYQVADAPLFHGRRRLVAGLVGRLVDTRLLVVSGASGAGKSSVVRAGVVPALGSGAVAGSEAWRPVIITPGRRPVDALAELTGDPPPETPVILVVDQCEEVWAPGIAPTERAAFFDAVLGLLDDGIVARCVVVVRGDHVGRLAEHAPFAERVGAALVLVPAPTDPELREIVREPARSVGLEVEPELVDAVVADVLGQPGALPLLSTALVGTWERRRGDTLSLGGYLEAGGVAGALTRSAEAVHAELDEEGQRIARRLLVRLADVDDGGALIRRSVPVAELDLDGERGRPRRDVVEAFVRRRLLAVHGESLEVAHEALLTAWPRLARWLEEDAAGRAVRRRLAPAARDWQASGRPEEELYRGARLEAALDWANGPDAEVVLVEQEFLDASKALADVALLREVAAHRRTRRLALATAVVCVIALVGAGLAVHSQQEAQRAAVVAEAERVARTSATVAPLDLALLLAAEGFRLADSPTTRERLSSAVTRYGRAVRVVPLSFPVDYGALTDGGRTLFVEANAGLVALPLDEEAGPTTRLPLPNLLNAWAERSGEDASHNGAMLAAVGSNRTGPWLWAITDRHLALSLTGDDVGGVPFGVSFTADDALLNVFVSSPPGADGRIPWRVRQVDLASGTSRSTDLAGSVPADGSPLVSPSGDGTTAVVWSSTGAEPPVFVDLASGRQVALRTVDRGLPVVGYRSLPTGAAQLWDDGTVDLYDRSGERAHTLPPSRKEAPAPAVVHDVVLAPDGTWGATVGDWPAVVLWDVDPASGRWTSREVLWGHAGAISKVDIDPTGQRLVTLAYGDRAIVWDVRQREAPGSPSTPPSSWLRAACSVAGRDLSHAEWDRYLLERPWAPTCSDLE